MNGLIEDRLKQIFADVFETEPDRISADMSVDNTETWDSMRSIVLASSVETEFALEFSDDELVSLDSFEKVLAAVKSREP